LRELKGVDELGGTMRLGAFTIACWLKQFRARRIRPAPDQRAPSPSLRIQSRIRRRVDRTRLRLTGETPDAVYVEICELADHPWYLGCQFHPEFKSKPLEPHPLFRAFIGAAVTERDRRHRAAEEASGDA